MLSVVGAMFVVPVTSSPPRPPVQVLQARGRSYHPSCFRCLTCRRPLEGLPFTVGPDRQPYWLRDYHR